ncbi:multidrug/pheromone exporter protein, partial [Genlisea aurea]
SFCSIFGHADGWDWLLMCLGLIGTVGDGISMPFMLLFTSSLFNSYGKSGQSFRNDVSGTIDKNVLDLCYIALALWGACFLEGYCWTRTAERQASRMRARYLKAVMRQDVGYFDVHVASMAEVIESVSTDSLVIQGVISEKFPIFMMNLSTFLGAYVTGFILYWRLAVVGFPFVVLLIVPGMIYGRALINIAVKMKEEYNKASGVVEQAVSSIRTVYSFVGEAATIDSYSSTLGGTVKLGLKQGLAKGLAIGTNGITFAIWSFLAYYGSRLVMYHGAEGGTVFAVVTSITIGGIALGSGLSNVKYFSEASTAAERISEMIKRVPSIDSDSAEGQVLGSVRGEVELKRVRFAYPSRPESLIFSDFSLRIPAGKMVALVGASGSGKSTVIALLQRFYDPSGGEIRLDGAAIDKLRLKWLRSQMGLVSQEPAMFATTIKANILFGKEDAPMEEIVEAAKASNAHNFILQLPQGYDTQVGEGGIQISGGQKQRIAIARAIIKSPKILLLDEATSALDSESERIVQEALDEVAVGRTTIAIAHRLSTIRHADLIAVIHDGQVAEIGSHDDLAANPQGLYTGLLRLQQMENPQNSAIPADGHANDAEVERVSIVSTSRRLSDIGSSREAKEEPASSSSAAIEVPSFKRLLAMNSPEWKQAALGCLGASLFGMVQPVYAFALGSMISVFFLTDHRVIEDRVRIYSLCFLGLAIFSMTINVVQHYNFAYMGEQLTKRLREKVMYKVLTFEVGWFDKEENSTGSVCSRLAKDANVV